MEKKAFSRMFAEVLAGLLVLCNAIPSSAQDIFEQRFEEPKLSSAPLVPQPNQWQSWFLNPIQPVVDFATDINTQSSNLFNSFLPEDNSAINSFIQAKESESNGQLELAHSQYIAAFTSASMQKRFDPVLMERILEKLNNLRHRLGMESYFG